MRVFGERKEDEATELDKAAEGYEYAAAHLASVYHGFSVNAVEERTLGERRPIFNALPALDEGILPSLSLSGTSDMLSLVCGLQPPPPPPVC